MDKQMTAEQILEKIKNIDNEERWKLLDMLYDEYYNPRKNEKGKLEVRIENLEKDVKFLSGKVGINEMRIHSLMKSQEED